LEKSKHWGSQALLLKPSYIRGNSVKLATLGARSIMGVLIVRETSIDL
jgi:hypothetical protein